MSPGLLWGGEKARPLGIKRKGLRRKASQCEGRMQNATYVHVVHSSDHSAGHTNCAFQLDSEVRVWAYLIFPLTHIPYIPLHESNPGETSTHCL